MVSLFMIIVGKVLNFFISYCEVSAQQLIMHMLHLGSYILTLLLSLSITGDAASCGPNKRCVCANAIMDCRRQSLTKFPDTIDGDIKAVYLDDNQISSLDQIPDDSQLQTLVLKHNKITTLRYDAFDNLDNLKTLYLSNNSIEVISDDIFEWNPLKLEVLYLDSNKLEFIQHFLFYDLEELTDLYLQNNQIVFIHPHAFLQLKNLRNLRLDGNKLHTFNHRWIDKLEANMFTELRFDNNPWSCDCAMDHSFAWLGKPKSKWFHELTSSHSLVCETPLSSKNVNFKVLDKKQAVKQCDMPKIIGISKPSALKPTQNVKLRCVVKQKTYPIPTISWTAPNGDVYRLNTAINYDGIVVGIDGSLLIKNLSNIDSGAYTCNASNTRGSHIATTNLTIEGDRPSNILSTSTIYLKSTQSPDPTRTAVPMKHCPPSCQCISRHIDCSGDGSDSNKIARTNVPKDIPKDAITISLAGNEIKSIGSHDFTEYVDLEELRLDDNIISNVDTHAFNSLAKLTTLTLQQNQLKLVKDHTFSKLHKLTVLVLDRNLIAELRREMFWGLDSLRWLYVRHNEIESFSPDVFKHLPQIKFIHLESNKLRTLPSGSFPPFKQLPYLRKMFVDENNFQCGREMESVRLQIRETEFKNKHNDFYGDGIICSSPTEYFDKNLADIGEALTWSGEDATAAITLTKSPPPTTSSYSGLLFGGIAVGVILTFVILILWRKYGRTVRTKGRSYNYSDLRGNDDNEKSGLTDNMGGQEAFV